MHSRWFFCIIDMIKSTLVVGPPVLDCLRSSLATRLDFSTCTLVTPSPSMPCTDPRVTSQHTAPYHSQQQFRFCTQNAVADFPQLLISPRPPGADPNKHSTSVDEQIQPASLVSPHTYLTPNLSVAFQTQRKGAFPLLCFAPAPDRWHMKLYFLPAYLGRVLLRPTPY